MSEEIKEMLFKLKRQNTYEDIGYFKTALSNEDVDLLLNYIDNLQQENQQLKEDYSKLLETSKAYKKLLKTTMEKEHKATHLLDEIREYIETNKRITSSYFNGKEYEYTNYELVCEPNDLLQILDKVKE